MKRETKNEGFTLIETISAMTLLLVLASVASVLFFTVRRTIAKSTEAGGEAFALLKADQGLREIAEHIVVPYWEEAGRGIERASEQIEGKKKELGIEVLAIAAEKNNGMIVMYRAGEKEAACRVRFGSLPVWGDE